MGRMPRAIAMSLALAIGLAIATGACALATTGLNTAGDTSDGGHDASEGTDAPVTSGDSSPMEAAARLDATTTTPDAGEGMGDDASDAMEVPEVSPTCPPANPAQCGGTCMADCSQCATGNLWCKATGGCMADCTECPDRPVECFACSGNAPPDDSRGSCEVEDASAYCLGGRDYYDGVKGTGPFGTTFQHHCACNVASDCPGMTQVCNTTVGCQTCGEVGSGGQQPTTPMETCKNGQPCNPMLAQCGP